MNLPKEKSMTLRIDSPSHDHWMFWKKTHRKLQKHHDNKFIWSVVSTPLKNISQIGNHPQIGVKIKYIWNHHLAMYFRTFLEVICQATSPRFPQLTALKELRERHLHSMALRGWWSDDGWWCWTYWPQEKHGIFSWMDAHLFDEWNGMD